MIPTRYIHMVYLTFVLVHANYHSELRLCAKGVIHNSWYLRCYLSPTPISSATMKSEYFFPDKKWHHNNLLKNSR